MLYSVLPPQSDSRNWKILDDDGHVVFSGIHEQCEEWLDLADLREALRGQSSPPAGDQPPPRLPVFDLAVRLLHCFWGDCAGEVRVSGEAPAIFLMLAAMVCLSNQLVWPSAVQHASLIRGASAVAYGSHCCGASVVTHGEASCASSRTLDMVCDGVDELP